MAQVMLIDAAVKYAVYASILFANFPMAVSKSSGSFEYVFPETHTIGLLK